MSDEINRESTTKKVTSNSNTPMSGDNSSSGLILGVLLTLFVGAGAVAYFMNNRQAPTQILVPNATDTTKENKSTTIERSNTTIKEAAPTTSQPAPKVEINLPPAAIQPTPTPAATAQPQTMTSPRPAN